MHDRAHGPASIERRRCERRRGDRSGDDTQSPNCSQPGILGSKVNAHTPVTSIDKTGNVSPRPRPEIDHGSTGLPSQQLDKLIAYVEPTTRELASRLLAGLFVVVGPQVSLYIHDCKLHQQRIQPPS